MAIREWLPRKALSDDDPVVSVSQIVAYNVARARQARGLTQQQLGDRLSQVTGKAWPRTAVTMAENSWDAEPARVRKFDVNQIVALAFVLDVPISWFFMPPDRTPGGAKIPSDEAWIVCGADGETVFDSAYLRWLTLGRFDKSDPSDLMASRIRAEAPQFAALEPVENLVTAPGGGPP